MLIVLRVIVAMDFGGLFSFDCLCLFACLQFVLSATGGFVVCLYVCCLCGLVGVIVGVIVFVAICAFQILLCGLLLLCVCCL